MKIRFLAFLFLFFPFCGYGAFVDVDVTHPHYHAIEFLRTRGVVKGFERSDGTFFQPYASVFRSEALKMFLLAGGIPLSEEAGVFFPDVPEKEWFSPYVRTAVEKGIVNGYPDGTFRPAGKVTRAEALKMLFLVFQVPLEDEVSDEDWYLRFFRAAYRFGILNPDTKDPVEEITRGELAELIFRTIRVKSKDFQWKYRYSGSGVVSHYGDSLAGRRTADGGVYDPEALTAAHRTLPFGTFVRVMYGDKSVIVKITDRGPYRLDRVLDLSRGAFEKLAPKSKGILYVDFEVVSDPTSPEKPLPDIIQSSLSTPAQNVLTPRSVVRNMDSKQFREKEDFSVSLLGDTRALFGGTTSFLAKDFFPNLELRKPFSQKVLRGTVMNLSGTARDWNHKTVTVFFQKLENGAVIENSPQIQFSGPVSGKNFEVPLLLTESGVFQMGIVFDEETLSRVGVVEIFDREQNRILPESSKKFSSTLSVRLNPEKSEVFLDISSVPLGTLSKIDFSQGIKKKSLFVEDGISSLKIPYSFFSDFEAGKDLAIDLYQANSLDSTLWTQNTRFEKVFYVNYRLWPGFQDSEEKGISISSFSRFVKNNTSSVTVRGKKNSKDVFLDDIVYIILPSGLVQTVPLEFLSSDTFQFTFSPQGEGPYVAQILSQEKETLFKRAIYVSSAQILPVLPWPRISVGADSRAGIRHWINALRANYGIPIVSENPKLNTFAQDYAERMAKYNFISHTSNDGVSFGDRIKKEGLIGEFGENLSYATQFPFALFGLETSPAHRYNILSRKWGQVGIGLARNSAGDVYIVQLFQK